MKYIELLSVDGVSTFKERKIIQKNHQPLGDYSDPYQVRQIYFREFDEHQIFDWHCAPREQFIFYLEGEVKITTSSGEQHIFRAGDILLAKDLCGEGHVSETLIPGRAVIAVLDHSSAVGH
ncbi:cupin domain-containing protein [Microbulbifer sp. TRSA005]|uniref:cupin domain-containing protein n=1 Tax=Microbulbifer sp. TRSA005 TaxID=3243383 RepID=UPI0040398DB2